MKSMIDPRWTQIPFPENFVLSAQLGSVVDVDAAVGDPSPRMPLAVLDTSNLFIPGALAARSEGGAPQELGAGLGAPLDGDSGGPLTQKKRGNAGDDTVGMMLMAAPRLAVVQGSGRAVPVTNDDDPMGNGVSREPLRPAPVTLAGGRVLAGDDFGALVDELFERMVKQSPEFAALVDSVKTQGLGPAVMADQLAREALRIALQTGLIDPQTVLTQNVGSLNSPYANTPLPDVAYPGDLAIENRIFGATRWNAAAAVLKANKEHEGIGGHVGTGQSNAVLQLVLLMCFLHAENEGHAGDVFLTQGHDGTIDYAFEYLQGNITYEQFFEYFRREVEGKGVSSYAHQRLMPNFWHLSTVSMGLAAQLAIRYAVFMRYTHDHKHYNGPERHIWCILGDGSLAEPETWADLDLAARLKLDNITIVINANLIGLDHPVTPRDQIIQRTEARFRGNGWNVIKLIFGPKWDAILAADTSGLIAQRMGTLSDDELRDLTRASGAAIREEFFGRTKSVDGDENPRLSALVAHLSDDDLVALFKDWGGHDPLRVFQAYHAAKNHKGQPTVIIAMTTKGRDMGTTAGSDEIHSVKKMGGGNVLALRDGTSVPLADDDAFHFKPVALSDEDGAYLAAKRAELGGPFFAERRGVNPPVVPPVDGTFDPVLKGSIKGAPPIESESALAPGAADPALADYVTRVVPAVESGDIKVVSSPKSTTMVLGDIIKLLMADPNIGPYLIPILADEAQTFGMDALFKTVGIYDPRPEISPRKKGAVWQGPEGRVFDVGISEAAALSVMTAAGVEGFLPVFTGYSAFYARRVADQIMAAADMRVRAFMMAGTSGGTTINGEGLQHQERSDALILSGNPAVFCYDPAFGYELAILVREYIKKMFVQNQRIMPYINVYNENIANPAMPRGMDPKALTEGILKGLYLFAPADKIYGPAPSGTRRAQITVSGITLQAALKAQRLLATRFGVYADVWSAPSWSELRRDAEKCDFINSRHPEREALVPYVTRQLAHTSGPIIAATDYMRSVPQQVAKWLDPRRFYTLGTDGFGRSDTRVALRRFFGVDAEHIAYMTLFGLLEQGRQEKAVLRGPAARYRARASGLDLPPYRLEELLAARRELGIDPDAPYPPEWPVL